MTEYDPLEIELAALRPVEPSAALRRQIANRLAAASTGRTNVRRSFWRGGGMVGGLLAASLAAVLAWHDDHQESQSQPAAALDIDVATMFDTAFPSLWSYRSALSQQPQSLDELLDQYVVHTREPSPETPAFVVARWNSEFDAFTGEM